MSDYRKSKLQERYENDPIFFQTVKCLFDLMVRHGITPSEIREATFFAHMQYEMEHPTQSIIIVKDSMRKLYGLDD